MGFVGNKKQCIDQLNSFLRGEMSAVESYQLALEHVDNTSAARPQLEACRQSHEQRVEIIRTQILRMGGTPSDGAGAWGAFAKVVESSAALLGDRVAIDALEAGEDHGLKDYVTDVKKLDIDTRQLVTSTLLPQQEETHRAMSALKRQLS